MLPTKKKEGFGIKGLLKWMAKFGRSKNPKVWPFLIPNGFGLVWIRNFGKKWVI